LLEDANLKHGKNSKGGEAYSSGRRIGQETTGGAEQKVEGEENVKKLLRRGRGARKDLGGER